MIIPKKIKDGAKNVRVEYVTPVQHEDAGSYSHYSSTIQLWRINKRDGFEEPDQAETFMHEIVERINAENDLKLKHWQLTSISTNLFRILRENKLDFTSNTVEDSNLADKVNGNES